MRNHGKPRADPGPPQFHPGHRATKWPIFSFVPLSHLRLVTLWDDPPAWFASRGLPLPEAGMITGSR